MLKVKTLKCCFHCAIGGSPHYNNVMIHYIYSDIVTIKNIFNNYESDYNKCARDHTTQTG